MSGRIAVADDDDDDDDDEDDTISSRSTRMRSALTSSSSTDAAPAESATSSLPAHARATEASAPVSIRLTVCVRESMDEDGDSRDGSQKVGIETNRWLRQAISPFFI